MATPTFQGHQAAPEQEAIQKARAEHWRKIGNEAPVQAIARLEEAAKQLVGLNGTLQGLYFAIFAFSDFRKQVISLTEPIPGWLILLAFLLPLLFWLISLYNATRVFIPEVRLGGDTNDISINAWEKIEKTYKDTVDEKRKWLHRSHQWLVASFGVVLVLLVMLIFIPDKPASSPTEIIILTPTAEPSATPTP